MQRPFVYNRGNATKEKGRTMTAPTRTASIAEGDVRLSDLVRRSGVCPSGATVRHSSAGVGGHRQVSAHRRRSQQFCRRHAVLPPRCRFGKSLNMTMLKSFFEIPRPSDPNAEDAAYLFEGLSIWDADDGRYREPSGALIPLSTSASIR